MAGPGYYNLFPVNARRVPLDLTGYNYFRYNNFNDPNAFPGVAVTTETSRLPALSDGATGTGQLHFSFSWHSVLLPEARDILAYHIAYSQALSSLSWSPDTTNGRDGTWNNVGAPLTNGRQTVPHHHVPNAVAWPAVTGVRWWRSFGGADPYLTNFWLWESIIPGRNRAHMIFIDPVTGLEFGASGGTDPGDIRFGDLPRGTVRDRNFTVRNNAAIPTTGGTIFVETIGYDDGASMYSIDDIPSTGFANSKAFGVLAAAPGPGNDLPMVLRIDIPDNFGDIGFGAYSTHNERLRVNANY